MILYRIRNWHKHYENNRTKDLIKTSWVPIPNNHDSDGYTTLLSRPNGAAIFGAWIALVQVASKCDPRGTLLRRPGLPHDPESLSRITRIPKSVFEEAIEVSMHECNWLEFDDLQIELEIPQASAAPPQASAPRARVRNGMEWNGKNGMEEKGIELDLEVPISNDPLKLRLGNLFGRRSTTRWSEKEIKAFQTISPISPEDLSLVEKYYGANHPSGMDYRRRDLCTLLNNFAGEVDRARNFNPNSLKNPNTRRNTEGGSIQEKIDVPSV